MKCAINLFSELGRRLRNFGDDAQTQNVIETACRTNAWFTPREVRRAVEAIAGSMLRQEKLEAWLAPYPVPVAAPCRVLVIMAGNIPLVGFFDLLCVIASGHRCLVKPSGKDAVLVEYIIDLLREIDPEIAVEFYDGSSRPDAVIATGSDNTNRYFKTCFADIPALLRGNRQSVAVLSGRETREQLAGLADDIWAYSGLGCRNVSLLFVPEGYTPNLQMPAMNPKYYNNYLQTKALLTMTGMRFTDLGCAVSMPQQVFPKMLSELSVAVYKELSEVEAWLAAHEDELQCVVSTCLTHPRRVNFGHAQSPGLTDYPDDRDILAFLTTEVR